MLTALGAKSQPPRAELLIHFDLPKKKVGDTSSQGAIDYCELRVCTNFAEDTERPDTFAPLQEILAGQPSVLGGSDDGSAGEAIAIYFLVAHQLPAFRTIESWLSQPIEVMPVHALDIFSTTS